MKTTKILLSWVLTLCLLITPFSGSIVFASAAEGPVISFNIAPYAYVNSGDSITVSYEGSAPVTCEVKLEGKVISTDTAGCTFMPWQHDAEDGVYTLVAKATDADGVSATEILPFVVDDNMDYDYELSDNDIAPEDHGTPVLYDVNELGFTAGFGATQDGEIDLADTYEYKQGEDTVMRYKLNDGVTLTSVSGIPYQTFDIDLEGATEGRAAIHYNGETKVGERIAVKVYNPTTELWDSIGTFTGKGTVSEAVDIATYNDNGEIHVAAVLDYVTNGSDTMIWSTDPQHYTKFEDLYEYYYKVYQYAAEEYLAGNAGYILTTGDLVDDRPSSSAAAKQWEVADQAMSYVDEVGMPNGLVSGNHDVGDNKKPDYSGGLPNSDYSKFWETFPASRYNKQPWFGGSLNNNVSHYDLITIGNVDFIVMYLGYGLEATEETIAWANEVLQTYSHRTAIITTHEYLDAGAAIRSTTSRAQLIFDKIIDPNPNVKAILCGHDDGSLCLEKTASDGRTVYEILCDYQFVEAEDPSFYENEHYIGSVPHCCGDGYIRLMTVKGDTLSSVTYSPVTGRYNPYGDRENIAIDLDCGAADREITTHQFSAAVLLNEVTEPQGDWVGAVETIHYELLTASAENPAATPDNPYYAHAASAAPEVENKVDVLNAIGLSNGAKVTGWAAYGNSALNLNIDLNTTPYLYYSVTQPADSNFCFAFINNSNLAPWIVFRDATGEGAYLNNGNGNWDSYKNREQYITTSETGCIDMREHVTASNTSLKWILNQVTFYNSIGKEVSVDYMFFGSAPVEPAPPVQSKPLASDWTYSPVQYATAPDTTVTPTGTNAIVDKAPYLALYDEAAAMDLSVYTEESAQAVRDALDVTTPAVEDVALYQGLYVDLAEALGALKLYVEPISKDGLATMHNFDFTLTKWRNNDASVPITSSRSYITATATEAGGIRMEKSSVATNTWPSARYATTNIVLKPVNGKIYVDLDVNADSAWCIYLEVQQANKSAAVRLNFAIENAFNSITSDGFQGHFKGVYDVTEAFTKNGFDVNASMTVARTLLYIVPGGVTYDHIELLTETSDKAVDTSALSALVNTAKALDQTLYTSSTWAALQAALPNAEVLLIDPTATQSDINLGVIELQLVIDKLKLLTDVVVEPEGSLIPGDEGLWVPNAQNVMNIYRNDDNYTVLQNTNDQWPYADYVYPEAMPVTVADHQVSFDITVGSATNIHLSFDNVWVSMSKYISAANTSGEDLQKGTYTVDVPLSSITQIAGKETVSISKTRVYSVGASADSAVTIRKMQITDYVAPPPVADDYISFMPETMDDTSTAATAGSHELYANDLYIHSDAENGYRMQIIKDIELYDLTKLNAIRMNVDSEVPFKIAFNIKSYNDETAQWFTTSDAPYSHLYTVESDRVPAGSYDVYYDILGNTTAIQDKSSVYMVSVTIVTTGEGTFRLKDLEAVYKDLFRWPDGITYGAPATPENPIFKHAAKDAPRVAEKVDLLEAIGLTEHPTITGWCSYGNQTLGLEIDLNKTPYLYYSVAVPAESNFCFSLYNNSNYSPWLMFRDGTMDGAALNKDAANWDAYTNREQYITTSETGCIDMRQYLKTSTLKWVVNAVAFYNSTGKSDVISYMFFGSAPLPDPEPGDVNGDGAINMNDALDLYGLANGTIEPTAENAAYADVNNDGKVDTLDALILYSVVNGNLPADTIKSYYAPTN